MSPILKRGTKWSKKEIKTLIRGIRKYGTSTKPLHALLPQRSASAVKSKIIDWRRNADKNSYMDELGDEIEEVLEKHSISPHWSKDEFDELIAVTRKVGFRARDIHKLMPQRTE